MTHRVRRGSAALVVGATLVLAGCGTVRTDRAAVVDGEVIPQSTVQDATREINGMEPALLQEDLAPSGTLTALIQGSVVLDYLADKEVVVSESAARQEAAARGVDDPSEGTLDIIRFATALSRAQESGTFGEAEAAELTQQLGELDVEVNPRYGEYDPETATVGLTQPDWITPFDAPE